MMRWITGSLIVFFMAMGAISFTESHAQGQTLYNVAIQKNLEYVKRDTLSLQGDIYRPANTDGSPIINIRFPAFILIHGGGWTTGSKDVQFVDLARWLAQRGYVTFNIDYRLNAEGRFPNSVLDVLCAVKFLKYNERDLRIATGHIALMGGSAGGYLAAEAGAIGDNQKLLRSSEWATNCGASDRVNPSVHTVIPAYGPYDFESVLANPVPSLTSDALNQYAGILPGDSVAVKYQKYQKVSVLTYLTKKTGSRWFIMHGTADPLIPVTQAPLLYDVLTSLHVRANVSLVQGASHGFFDFPQQFPNDYNHALQLLEPWLDRYFPGR